MSKYIPLSEPMLKGREWQYVKECLDSTWISSAGKYVDLFEKRIAEYTNTKYAISCINGTSALHIALKLVGVVPGDEVIVPDLTFVASPNSVEATGAKPILIDIEPQSLNLDLQKLSHKI